MRKLMYKEAFVDRLLSVHSAFVVDANAVATSYCLLCVVFIRSFSTSIIHLVLQEYTQEKYTYLLPEHTLVLITYL